MNILFHPRFNNQHPSEDCIPNHVGISGHRKFKEMVANWRSVFPESKAEKIDFEDWTENAWRMHVFKQCQPNESLYVYQYGNIYLDGKQQSHEDLAGRSFFIIGSHTVSEQELQAKYDIQILNEEQGVATGYARTKTFQEFAKRKIMLVNAEHKGEHSIYKALANFRDEGHKVVFIKVNRPKYGIEEIEPTPEGFAGSNTAWASVHLAGDKDAFIIQERVDMESEYRFIVVNNQVVAGAGCIEEFTPLNNAGAQFHMALRKDRKNVSRVVQDLSTKSDVVKMHDYATQFVKSMQAERSDFSHYTLDVALTPDGEPLVVECNPLENYGLYAMDYMFVLAAQMRYYELKHLRSGYEIPDDDVIAAPR